MNKNGLTLIGLIIIIVLLAIIALGIATYIAEALRLNITNINQEKALYVAQAGIMKAIVDYKDGDSKWSPARDVNIGGEFYYDVGVDANFLLVDPSKPTVYRKLLYDIPIRNISLARGITLTEMKVDWTFGGQIKRIKFGTTVVWSGTASSGSTLNINPDFFIGAGTSFTTSTWEFSTNINIDREVVATFIFSDGSRRQAYLFKNRAGSNKEFSIKATGEIRNGANVEARRTLVATYDIGTNNITSWQETQDHIAP